MGKGEAGVGPGRFPAIDLLRGVVMVLMTVDHASETFNRGRVFTDSVMFWKPGTPLPAAQFLTRWMTHLCAPTFVLLAGTSLAIAVESRRAKGDSERAIDRYILSRGALIVAFEIFWMSPVMLDPGRVLFQVLYAIGGSLMAMALLRRLSDGALAALGFAIVLGAEAAIGGLHALGVDYTIPAALLVSAGFFADRRFIIAYPLLAQHQKIPVWLPIVLVLAAALTAYQLPGTILLTPTAVLQRYWFRGDRIIQYHEVMAIQSIQAGRITRVLGDNRMTIIHNTAHSAAEQFRTELARRTNKRITT